jgi:Zn-dependent protease
MDKGSTFMTEEKKIYTSFHDIPVREYMYFPKGTLEVGKPGKFSKVEIFHLLVSIFILTIAFSFALSKNNLFIGFTSGFRLDELTLYIPLSFLGITTAFFFHELSHKFMAQKHGLWSEYRMFPQGLFLALLLGILTPFVFAAPGAVMFQGGAKTHETGQIAASGPLANIIIAFVTFFLYTIVFYETQIGSILGFVCLINAFIATFNLLPLGPLDGIKIIKWNATVWIIMLITSVSIAVFLLTKSPIVL